MGPSAALPDAEAARNLSNTAGDAFWAEFWGIHEQLIDFAAIAAAHEDFFKAEAAHQAPPPAKGQPAPTAAAAASGMAARAAAAQLHRSEDEEAASWAEIILQCDRPTGAPAPAPASALAGAAGGAKARVGAGAGAAQPGRAILMGAKQPGALPPPAAAAAAAGSGRAILMCAQQPGALPPPPEAGGLGSLSLGGAPGKSSAGPALDGWQLGAFWPGAIGRRLSASEAAEAVDVGEMPVSCSASLSVHLAGTSYAEQLKLAAAAAAAGWTSWSSQQRPASQSERLLGDRPAQGALPALGQASGRGLLPPSSSS
jgi:hypothetical protein